MTRLSIIAGLGVVLGLGGCRTSVNGRYCDDLTPCADGRWPVCDRVAHQCREAADSGADDGGAAEDGPAEAGAGADAAHADGSAPDGAPDAGGADGGGDTGAPDDAAVPSDAGPDTSSVDAGCVAPDHLCGGACVPLDDPSHCGPGCLTCGGSTPACDGTSCVCAASSCPDAQPICGVTGACRACGGHAECEQRDPW